MKSLHKLEQEANFYSTPELIDVIVPKGQT